MPYPKGAKIWLPNRRDGSGRYFHRDPDGRRWYGTAAEVREAALMPWRRKMLAERLKTQRLMRDSGTFDAWECAWYCAECRREAIHDGAMDAKIPHSIPISAESMLMLEAGSRLVLGKGETLNDYLAKLIEREISALQDAAESETGKREIPLTRHERAALDRLARQS